MHPLLFGNIKHIGLLDILQITGYNKLNYELRMMPDEEIMGRLWMQEGEVIDAIIGDKRAEDAFYEIVSWEDCSFEMHPIPEGCVHTIETPMWKMMMNATVPIDDSENNNEQEVDEDVNAAVDEEEDWGIRGDTSGISLVDVFQIYEANKKKACLILKDSKEGLGKIYFKDGYIVNAQFANKKGHDAAYEVLVANVKRYVITNSKEEFPEDEIMDIPGIVMEGLRRADETKLIKKETKVYANKLAEKILKRLDEGNLSDPEKLQLAKRYLPMGKITPALVLLKLAIDKNEEVARTAMKSMRSLAEPLLVTLAGDEETPPRVVHFLLVNFKNPAVQKAALHNPVLPIDGLVEYAPIAPKPALQVIRNMTKKLEASEALREAIKWNPNCDFGDLVDEIEPKEEEEKEKTLEQLIMEKRQEEKEKMNQPLTKMSKEDLMYLAKKGPTATKMILACHNDEAIACEVLEGLGEVEALSMAEVKGVNSAFLQAMYDHPVYRRTYLIFAAIAANPSAPKALAVSILPNLKVKELMDISKNADLSSAVRNAAKLRLEKH